MTLKYPILQFRLTKFQEPFIEFRDYILALDLGIYAISQLYLAIFIKKKELLAIKFVLAGMLLHALSFVFLRPFFFSNEYFYPLLFTNL